MLWHTTAGLRKPLISPVPLPSAPVLRPVKLRIRGSSQPFGGVQLVLCGDFFQLPPIGIGRGTTRFCFEAKTWDVSVDQSIVLKQVMVVVVVVVVVR